MNKEQIEELQSSLAQEHPPYSAEELAEKHPYLIPPGRAAVSTPKSYNRLVTTAREAIQNREDAERWRTACRVWREQRKRPPELGLDRGNDCFDTYDEAVDSLR